MTPRPVVRGQRQRESKVVHHTHPHSGPGRGETSVPPNPVERPEAACCCLRDVGTPFNPPPDRGGGPTADAEELPHSEYLRRKIPPPHHERTSWVKRGSRSCDTAAVTFPSLADAPPDKGRHSARSTIGVGESPSIPTLSHPKTPLTRCSASRRPDWRCVTHYLSGQRAEKRTPPCQPHGIENELTTHSTVTLPENQRQLAPTRSTQ
jgi:hypothetical protein